MQEYTFNLSRYCDIALTKHLVWIDMKAARAAIADIVGKLEASPLSLNSLGEAFEGTKRVKNIIELKKTGLYKAESRFITSFEMAPNNQLKVKCDWYRRTSGHDSYEHVDELYNENRSPSELTS